jgi:hypothetical protein
MPLRQSMALSQLKKKNMQTAAQKGSRMPWLFLKNAAMLNYFLMEC